MEEWRDVTDYPGYQVSNEGRVRSFWKKQKKKGCWGGYERVLSDEPRILSQSDDGNGYMKVFIQNGEKRYCKKVHRLVAKEFIPNPDGLETVDHIKPGREGKLDNSVNNLQWMTRKENLQKAYGDGSFGKAIEGRNKYVMCKDICTGLERMYDSNKEAAYDLNVDPSTISHSKNSHNDVLVSHRYMFYKPNGEDYLLNWGLTGDDVWHP